MIPLAALKASIGKAAYAYTDKHVGARRQQGRHAGKQAESCDGRDEVVS